MSNDDSNNKSSIQASQTAFGVGRIVVAVATTLAFVSFFLPWIDLMIIKQHAFAVAQMMSERSMIGAIIWLGPIFLAFIHPAWVMLAKKDITRGDRIRGFLCAVIGFAWGSDFHEANPKWSTARGARKRNRHRSLFIPLCLYCIDSRNGTVRPPTKIRAAIVRLRSTKPFNL